MSDSIAINKIYCVINKENKQKDSKILDRTAKKIESYFSHLQHKKVAKSEIVNTVGKCLSTYNNVFTRDKTLIKMRPNQKKNGENDLLIILQEKEKLSNIALGLNPSFKKPGFNIALLNNNYLGYLYIVSVHLQLTKNHFDIFFKICNPILILWKFTTFINLMVGYKNSNLFSNIILKNKITKNTYFKNNFEVIKTLSGIKIEKNHSLIYANLNDGYLPTNKSIYANATIDSQNNLVNQIICWIPLKYGFLIGLNSNKFKLNKNFKTEFNPTYFLQYVLNSFIIFEYESSFWYAKKKIYKLSILFRTAFFVISIPLLTESKRKFSLNFFKQVKIHQNYLQE